MNTNKTFFKKFKAEFTRFATELGLTHYEYIFYHEGLPDCNAQIKARHNGKTAAVSLGTDIESHCNCTPERLARHEALHLLLADLEGLATYRYAAAIEIDDETERIVRRLEKMFL